jgi:hypothetical protein
MTMDHLNTARQIVRDPKGKSDDDVLAACEALMLYGDAFDWCEAEPVQRAVMIGIYARRDTVVDLRIVGAAFAALIGFLAFSFFL